MSTKILNGTHDPKDKRRRGGYIIKPSSQVIDDDDRYAPQLPYVIHFNYYECDTSREDLLPRANSYMDAH